MLSMRVELIGSLIINESIINRFGVQSKLNLIRYFSGLSILDTECVRANTIYILPPTIDAN